jgi:ABC-2 type transport system permease protein
MDSMRLFWRLVRQSFRLQLTYRAANLAGLATNFFFGLLRAAVLIALYGARSSVEGLSLRDAVTFTGLSQATIACLSSFGWYRVADSVYTGEIANDLLKPIDYFSHWLARDLGRAAASFVMRALTIMVAYALFFDIVVPEGVGHWLLLGLSLLMSIVVSFCWRFLINLSAFWTPNARGIIRLAFGMSWFMSGFLMPLRLFPDWFVRVAYLTPFPSMVNTVIEVYLGVLAGPALAWALLGQLIWIGLLAALSRLVLRAGVRHLVIQGG